jgi:hypothetical protein
MKRASCYSRKGFIDGSAVERRTIFFKDAPKKADGGQINENRKNP